MRIIKISQNKEVLVDDEDFELLMKYRWSYSHGYAKRGTFRNKIKKSYYMHREIMGSPGGFDIDHINGNKLDNRKCNLRVVPHSVNINNRNTSPVKGFYFSDKNKKYVSTIKIHGKKITLGSFLTAAEATAAYNKAKADLFSLYPPGDGDSPHNP